MGSFGRGLVVVLAMTEFFGASAMASSLRGPLQKTSPVMMLPWVLDNELVLRRQL